MDTGYWLNTTMIYYHMLEPGRPRSLKPPGSAMTAPVGLFPWMVPVIGCSGQSYVGLK